MSTTKLVIIVGQGKFAESLLHEIPMLAKASGQKILTQAYGKRLERGSPTLIIHAGSGRQLPEVIALCQDQRLPLVQAATGQTHPVPAPLNFAWIEAPNLSLPIIKFMAAMQQVAHLFSGMDAQIRESHQSRKTTVPGTALTLAQAFGIAPDKIVSIRSPKQQSELSIPAEHLSGHAVHWLTLEGAGCRLEFKTEVYGRQPYAHGALALTTLAPTLPAGHYHITDLVAAGKI